MPNDSEQKLIEAIYSATIDSKQFSDLMLIWDDYFQKNSDEVTLADVEKPLNESAEFTNVVENHFFRAFAILDQIGDFNNQVAPTIKQIIEAELLNPNSKMQFSNIKIIDTN